MNLLPKTHEEFAKTDYWNAFFKKRGEKSFEWYGEYLELCEHIHKYVKPADNILMLGCGNSKLSMDMYDSGYRNITNIDISAVAIKKMTEVNARTRADMRFLQMDATAMEFPDESFSVALDKGTLDALFVDETTETQQTVEKYLKEIMRTMRNGGRYLCISLLQEHILKYILEFFPRNSFMVRIVYCLDTDRANQEKNSDNPDAMAMPVFIVVATKFKALPMPIFEYSLSSDRMQRVKTADELIAEVTSVQKAALVCWGLARNSLEHAEVKFDLWKPGDIEPRYTVYVMDQPASRNLGKYAAFIVPQGREIEWLFATPEGRKKLQASAGFQRLAVVLLHRDHTYDSLEAVKCELADSVKNLAPIGMKDQIPCLSLSGDVGKRETLVSGFSKISGDFLIEEIEGADGKVFRRLIFLSNQFVVQSEALVKTIKRKGKKERKKIDVGHLACQHHLYMSVGVQMAVAGKTAPEAQNDVLVVGLGGGGLCSFLHEAMPHIRITAVEIDPIMLEVAEQFFELKQDKRLHVVIDDGLAFLERCKEEDIHFDAILFDVDSKDLTLGMSCPPKSFLAPAVLANLTHVLGPKGIFILNLVCRDEVLRDQAHADLKCQFKAICSYKLDEDVNEIIYCANDDERCKALDDWRKSLGTSGRRLNELVRDSKLSNIDMLDVVPFLNDLRI